MIDRFLEHLAYEQRASPLTVQAYGRDLAQFTGFLRGELGVDGPATATGKMVRAWMMHLLESGTGARSVNRKLSALRAYYRFARTVGAACSDPTALVSAPKAPQRLPEFVPERNMAELLDRMPWPDGFTGLRDRLILELLYGTGMRLAELTGLGPASVDLRRGTLRVVGKRNKERILPLAAPLVDLLRSYLPEREALQPAAEAGLLIKPDGNPLPRRTVQSMVKHYLSAVTTQDKRSPHVLRHTFATHLLDHGADLNAVKELLGHANLAATQVYTHNTIEKLKQAHRQAHPRGGPEDHKHH
ncbi:MAG: tyrosine-type recombinase/integrase [Flavobacteriales bacterium]|nr:tyrosine-type recombinase/integrase [Flavobacteriales bacterium]MBP9079595.1 tyrosine-type recombinase/integrase [Flavobacteriales bacterium]